MIGSSRRHVTVLKLVVRAIPSWQACLLGADECRANAVSLLLYSYPSCLLRTIADTYFLMLDSRVDGNDDRVEPGVRCW